MYSIAFQIQFNRKIGKPQRKVVSYYNEITIYLSVVSTKITFVFVLHALIG